jgi:cell wall-associated NlpC family hydrolase
VITPQPADFFLAPISGLGGKAIRFGEFLNGQGFLKVQHAGIYMGNDYTVEAYPGGAIHGNIKRFAPDSLVWSTGLIELTSEQRLSIVAAAMRYIGVPYSELDYLAIAAHRFHIPAPHLREYIASTKHMICSQLVDQCYEDGGVHLFNDGGWPGYVDPGALFHLLDNIRENQTHQGVGY